MMAPIDKLSWELLDSILSRVPPDAYNSPLQYDANGSRDLTAEFLARLRTKRESLLPVYATVCKKWQSHFERRTFSCIRVRSPEFENFSKIVVGERRHALKWLQFVTILPEYSIKACAKFERRKDKWWNDDVFTESVHHIFRILESWEKETRLEMQAWNVHGKSWLDLPPLELSLVGAYSPTDVIYANTPYRSKRTTDGHGMGKVPHDLQATRYAHSHLQLLQSEDLPLLERRVRFTKLSENYTRRVMASTIATLGAKFKNLDTVNWVSNDSEDKYPMLRRIMRYDFSQALLAIQQPSLRRFELSYGCIAPRNHDFTPPTALHPLWPSTDWLSIALFNLYKCPNLTHIILRGQNVISSALYWNPEEGSTAPHWPNLQRFRVKFSMCTPDGDWYFVRRPDSIPNNNEFERHSERFRAERVMRMIALEPAATSDDSGTDDSSKPDTYDPFREMVRTGGAPNRHFRTWPNEEKLLPLLKAMAKAAACMPVIQHLSLYSWLHSNLRIRFEVTYLAPGVIWSPNADPDDDIQSYRLYWRVDDWRPDEELLSLWRRAVPQGEGNSLVIKYFPHAWRGG